MKPVSKIFQTGLLLMSFTWQASATAETVKMLPIHKEIKIRLPDTCLSCPPNGLLKPSFEQNLSKDEKLQVIRELDRAMDALKDLPHLSEELITSVDYWERLKHLEKEQLLAPEFGRVNNWAAAAVVVGVAQLAYQAYKDYKNSWRPGDLTFDGLRASQALDYGKAHSFKQLATKDLAMRLEFMKSPIMQGLRY